MAANRNSLERGLTSLENTLKSVSTCRPKFIDYITNTPGLPSEDLKHIVEFLVECLAILSRDTSSDDKLAKAKNLALGEEDRDPPCVLLNPSLKARLNDPEDVSDLEDAVKTIYRLNAESTIGTVFDDFVDDERKKMSTMCGSIGKPKKKSRTCVTL